MRTCFRWLGLLIAFNCSYWIGYFQGSSLCSQTVAAPGAATTARLVEGATAAAEEEEEEEDAGQKELDQLLQQQSEEQAAEATHTTEEQHATTRKATPSTVEQVMRAQEDKLPSQATPSRMASGDQGLFNDNLDFGGMGGHKGGSCAQFEGVNFPLDPEWGPSVRALNGASIYGTGWAQRRLREHQFPTSCEGKTFVEHGMFRSGMGSNIHISAAVMAFALNEGAIYVWPEDDLENPWTQGAEKGSAAECPGGSHVRSYECYFKPISSCKSDGHGSRFTGVKKDRGKKNLRGTEVIPNMFKPLLTCSGYPKDYWRKWWRAQVAAFLLRLTPATRRELDDFRRSVVVGEVKAGTIGTHVRHGDKYYEAEEYPLEDYLRLFDWISGNADSEFKKRCSSASKLLEPFAWQLPALKAAQRLYLGTDDPKVLEAATSSHSRWKISFMNVTRLSKRMPLMNLRKKLGPKQTVMESLLNLQLLMESDAFVCTWTSNWCRLVDEMRLTVASKANHLSLEINKHCPSFNWVHGMGKPTPDFR